MCPPHTISKVSGEFFSEKRGIGTLAYARSKLTIFEVWLDPKGVWMVATTTKNTPQKGPTTDLFWSFWVSRKKRGDDFFPDPLEVQPCLGDAGF